MSQVVIPLDPDSEHGKAIAARLSRTLAVIERELQETHPSGPAGPAPSGPAGPRPSSPEAPPKGRAA